MYIHITLALIAIRVIHFVSCVYSDIIHFVDVRFANIHLHVYICRICLIGAIINFHVWHVYSVPTTYY